MGPVKELFSKLPMFGGLAEQMEGDELVKVESMVHSMTRDERLQPELIDKSRAGRIARGSGRQPREVRELVGRFVQMREMMGKMGGAGGLLSRIPGLGSMAGAGGPELDPSALLGGGGRPQSEKAARRSGQARRKKRKNAKQARKRSRRK
jgi:signal recognition particle subunit SRP54